MLIFIFMVMFSFLLIDLLELISLCVLHLLIFCLFSKFDDYLGSYEIVFNRLLAGIKIAGRNINNLRDADDTTLMAESEEELKSLLMKVESEKVGLNSTFRKRRSWHPVPSLHGK